jgi:hypothetical protein
MLFVYLIETTPSMDYERTSEPAPEPPRRLTPVDNYTEPKRIEALVFAAPKAHSTSSG